MKAHRAQALPNHSRTQECGGDLTPTVAADCLRVGTAEVSRLRCTTCSREIYGSAGIRTCPLPPVALTQTEGAG
jgi:hypothetical protein